MILVHYTPSSFVSVSSFDIFLSTLLHAWDISAPPPPSRLYISLAATVRKSLRYVTLRVYVPMLEQKKNILERVRLRLRLRKVFDFQNCTICIIFSRTVVSCSFEWKLKIISDSFISKERYRINEWNLSSNIWIIIAFLVRYRSENQDLIIVNIKVYNSFTLEQRGKRESQEKALKKLMTSHKV